MSSSSFSKQACDFVVLHFFTIVLAKFNDAKSRPDMVGQLSANGLKSYNKRMSTRSIPDDFMASSLKDYQVHH